MDLFCGLQLRQYVIISVSFDIGIPTYQHG